MLPSQQAFCISALSHIPLLFFLCVKLHVRLMFYNFCGFSKCLLHFGCIVYHASKLCCLVIVLYTTVRRVPIIEEGRAASKIPHYKFGHFLSISQQGVTADIIQNSAVANLSPKTVGTSWPCVITDNYFMVPVPILKGIPFLTGP